MGQIRKQITKLNIFLFLIVSEPLVMAEVIVDPEKAAEILKGFDTTCEFCGIQSGSLNEANDHYKIHHNAGGYIKCCGLKFRKEKTVADHIKFHVKPDIFR